MLVVKNLQARGLHDINFAVRAGECLACVGASGSGKSTLLRAIADLDPNKGHVVLEGRDRTSFHAAEWRRLVGLVPAESGWWASNVGDHFLRRDGVGELLAAVDLPSDSLTWTVGRLSSGERHRLALVRALVLAPRCLLLDEPTAALDSSATARIELILKKKLSEGGIVVLVSHDPAQVDRLASSKIRIDDGMISSMEGAI